MKVQINSPALAGRRLHGKGLFFWEIPKAVQSQTDNNHTRIVWWPAVHIRIFRRSFLSF